MAPHAGETLVFYEADVQVSTEMDKEFIVSRPAELYRAWILKA